MYPVQDGLLPIGIIAGLLAGALVLAVSHGILRPLLEARGVSPWTLRDTLGATPLIVAGGGVVVGAGMAGTLALTAATTSPGPNGIGAQVLCLALLVAGALSVRLGLLALRKLT